MPTVSYTHLGKDDSSDHDSRWSSGDDRPAKDKNTWLQATFAKPTSLSYFKIVFETVSYTHLDVYKRQPYSLAPISVPLSLLYRLLPQLPWYPLMLLILIGASWSISLIQVMRSRMNDPLCLSLVTIFLACDVISTMYLTFTIVSFLTVSAGLMLLVGRSAFARDPRVHASDVVGLVLIVLGYALRPESGQVAFVLFSPFALWVLAANRNVASISRMLAAVLGVALCVGLGQAAYRSTPGWETYPDYLAAGRRSLDYPDLRCV